MSSDVHLDPVKLRTFADTLSTTVTFYRRSLEILESRLARLGSTWQDEQFREFAREVRTTRVIIEEFVKEALDARSKLLEDAAAAEAFQKINVRS